MPKNYHWRGRLQCVVRASRVWNVRLRSTLGPRPRRADRPRRRVSGTATGAHSASEPWGTRGTRGGDRAQTPPPGRPPAAARFQGRRGRPLCFDALSGKTPAPALRHWQGVVSAGTHGAYAPARPWPTASRCRLAPPATRARTPPGACPVPRLWPWPATRPWPPAASGTTRHVGAGPTGVTTSRRRGATGGQKNQTLSVAVRRRICYAPVRWTSRWRHEPVWATLPCARTALPRQAPATRARGAAGPQGLLGACGQRQVTCQAFGPTDCRAPRVGPPLPCGRAMRTRQGLRSGSEALSRPPACHRRPPRQPERPR